MKKEYMLLTLVHVYPKCSCFFGDIKSLKRIKLQSPILKLTQFFEVIRHQATKLFLNI